MANVKQTTVTGTVAGAPYPPHALPNTVTPASKALWVQAGTVANVATINQFVLANGGPGGVIFVAFKGQTPATMRGLSVGIAASVNGSGPPTTRGNCLLACSNGVSIGKAAASVKWGPVVPGKPPQKANTRPGTKSAWVALLQGTCSPNKYGGPPCFMLVAL